MNPTIKAATEQFIKVHKLPPNYIVTVEQWFLPLAESLLQKIAVHQGTFVLGISGCQGSGKSTLAELMVMMLEQLMGLRCINLSIDDFYLTRDERERLSKEVHPLLMTRGVPGTHDVDLAKKTIETLKGSGPVAIPRFDKAMDDRLDRQRWPSVLAPMDVIIVEGWCFGIGPQDNDQLLDPVNSLELNADERGHWRRYVNQSIRERYLDFYNLADYLLMLKAPAFEKVYEWRQNQELKLAEQIKPGEDHKVMDDNALLRFIQHYERVTRHGLETLPAQADCVFELTDEQTIKSRLK